MHGAFCCSAAEARKHGSLLSGTRAITGRTNFQNDFGRLCFQLMSAVSLASRAYRLTIRARTTRSHRLTRTRAMVSTDVATNPLLSWNYGRAGGVDMPQWSKVTPEHGASSLDCRRDHGKNFDGKDEHS